MNRSMKRTLAMLLALLMTLALAACDKTPVDNSHTDPQPQQSETEPKPDAPSDDPQPAKTGDVPLVVGADTFSEKFSPFFSKTAADQDAVRLTMVPLIGKDRSGNLILHGIEGETSNYNGTDYLYTGIADVDVTEKEDGAVVYAIKLRNDVKCSDGTPLTIDDVIFTMYVLADPAYDGSSSFCTLPITGMKEYRTGVKSEIYDKYKALAAAIEGAGKDNTDFSAWSEAQQTAYWGEYMTAGGAKFAQEIVAACVDQYAAYLTSVYHSEVALGMFCWGFGDVDEQGILTVKGTGSTFDLANGVEPTPSDFWDALAAFYEGDLETLNAVESPGSSLFDYAAECFISGEGPKDAEAGGVMDHIAGIVKTGDDACEVTVDSFEAASMEWLNLQIAPLHYYGDPAQYDYDHNRFGFPKGDLSLVKAKSDRPMGAGPYQFVSFENGIITYAANEFYWKGTPKTKYILFQEVSATDKLTGVLSGSFDVTAPPFTTEVVDSIKGYNSNGALTGDKITTNTVNRLSYGYLGICANTVKVGVQKDSDASKNLRKAFATLFSVYRNAAVSSYYGERAAVMESLISDPSRTASDPANTDYELAYSKDVDGNPIYTDSMSEQEKYDAALQAAIGFLKAAGYTWEDAAGRFTAAPDGAEMAYEVLISGNSVGDHPVYSVLTAAKEALAGIGLTLEINDLSDSNLLWTALAAGSAAMWVAEREAENDSALYEVYHSSNSIGLSGSNGSNYYSITSADLDQHILQARRSIDRSFRKETYRDCRNIILGWGVEVPMYQRQDAIVFSTERVKTDTVTPDITPFWGWMSEVEQIEMK